MNGEEVFKVKIDTDELDDLEFRLHKLKTQPLNLKINQLETSLKTATDKTSKGLGLEKISKNLDAGFGKKNINNLGNFEKGFQKLKKTIGATGKVLGGVFNVFKNLLMFGGGIFKTFALFATGGLLSFGLLTRMFNQSIQRETTAKNLGIKTSDIRAYEYASNQSFGEPEAILNGISNLVDNLYRPEKSADFGQLNLNQWALQKMSREDAFIAVLKAVEKFSKDFTPARNAFGNLTGMPEAYNRFTEKGEAEKVKLRIDEGRKIFKGLDEKGLRDFQMAVNSLKAKIELLAGHIAVKLAPVLEKFINVVSPVLEDLGNKFTKWLDSLTTADIQKAVDTFKSAVELFASILKGGLNLAIGTKRFIDNPKGYMKEKAHEIFDIEYMDSVLNSLSLGNVVKDRYNTTPKINRYSDEAIRNMGNNLTKEEQKKAQQWIQERFGIKNMSYSGENFTSRQVDIPANGRLVDTPSNLLNNGQPLKIQIELKSNGQHVQSVERTLNYMQQNIIPLNMFSPIVGK